MGWNLFSFGNRLPREDVGRDVSVGGSLSGYQNPDDLIGAKGIEVYDTMSRNAQVSACLSIKRASVLSRGWDVGVGEKSNGVREEVVEFCKYVFEWMDGSLFGVLENVCDALAKGYSIQSLVWDNIESGKFKGNVAPRYIYAKDPADWQFIVDDYRHVTGLLHTPTSERFSRSGFVVFTYRGIYGNPYGYSDLRNCYRNWWSVDFLERFWNMYMEKFGAPTVKGTYKRGLSAAAKATFMSALSAVQSKSALVFPEDMKVELLETIRQGESGFRLATEYHNKQIAKSILNQTLVTDSGGGVGSFAMAKVHLDVLRMCLRGLKQDLEETVVREQILRPLVAANYGADEPVPIFTLGPLEDREIEPLSRAAGNIVTAGILDPADPWFREFLGISGGGKSPAKPEAGPTVTRTRVDGNTNDASVKVG
jgi:phage gp29-like protein